jgi:protein-S-isoprenylcysteine O-methyltransferase Ste14
MTLSFCLGASYGAFIALGPVAIINHRHLDTLWTDQIFPKQCFYVLALITGGLAAILTKSVGQPAVGETHGVFRESMFSQPEGRCMASPLYIIDLAKSHAFEIFGSIAMFLYIACSALCEHLHIALLKSRILPNEFCPILGLIIIFLAFTTQISSLWQATSSFSSTKQVLKKWTFAKEPINHPIYLGWLIFLIGIPFLFSTWFTLIAWPGALVLIKWQVIKQKGNVLAN